jgi:hypothetical protein
MEAARMTMPIFSARYDHPEYYQYSNQSIPSQSSRPLSGAAPKPIQAFPNTKVPPSQLAEQAHDFTAARGTSPPIPITAVRGNVTQTIVCAPTIAGLVVAKAVPNRSETSSEASSLSSSVSSITSESCYRSNDHNIIAARQAIAMASDASKVYKKTKIKWDAPVAL